MVPENFLIFELNLFITCSLEKSKLYLIANYSQIEIKRFIYHRYYGIVIRHRSINPGSKPQAALVMSTGLHFVKE